MGRQFALEHAGVSLAQVPAALVPDPSHWTAKLTAYLFTDCPCCLLFRGLVIGTVVTLMLLSVVLLLAVMVVAWKR